MEMLKERRLGIEKLNGRCKLNDSDDLEGKQECLPVRWVVNGDVDRVLRVNLWLQMQASQRLPLTDLPSRTLCGVGCGVGCGMHTANILLQ